MHKLQKLFCCVLLSMLCCSTIFAQNMATEPEKGILRVKLQPELLESISNRMTTRSGVVKTGATPMDVIHKKVKAVSMKRVFPYAPKFEEKMRKHGLHLWYEIRYDNDITPATAARMYKDIQGIQAVDMVVPMKLMDGSREAGTTTVPPVPTPKASSSLAPFNDPLIKWQWHYQNDGSLEGTVAGSDINLYKAWDITAGSPDVIVGIIDGGIDYMHEDLADNIWINEAELNGKEGVDDDGNGYIDDVYGWNFVRVSNVVYPHEHGTHVAGTVGAVNNNGIGVAGVAGGTGNHDGVKMMSCQIFDNVDGSNTDFAEAIVYAANNGAVIAQCSWGWTIPDYKEQAVLDAIDYFIAEAQNSTMKGGICIFATGNLGGTGDYYPSAYPPVVAVGAMCGDLKVATYTNHGAYVDITAPGGFMDFDTRLGVYSTKPRNQYGYLEGTSMACPHVSGVAALILSKYGNKNFTPEELRTRLLSAVQDIYKNNPEWIGEFGAGYIDAELALKENNKIAPDKIADFNLYASQQDVGVEWNIPDDGDDHQVFRHIIYWSNSAFTASSDFDKINSQEVDTKFNPVGEKLLVEIANLQASTDYWFAIQAIDRWGNKSELSPVKSARTNSGPIVSIDKTSLFLNVDVNNSYISTDQLTMSNSGEGLLKWTASVFRKNPDYFPPMINYAPQTASSLKPFSGTIHSNSVSPREIVQGDYMLEDYPKSITYSTEAEFNIGEVDTAFSNSLAQHFTVDAEKFPDGFNLTHLNMQGEQPNHGNVIMQVYGDAANITVAPLLLSDTMGTVSYSSDIPYSQQLYFAPGESFWIVVHVTSGNTNPLCTGKEEFEEYSQYSYYSSDMGKNWTLLEDVLKAAGGNLAETAATSVWAITAVSRYAALDGYFVLNPDKGNTAPSTSSQLEIATTETDIIDGEYNFNLVLKTNETNKERRSIPVYLTVSGHKAELHSARAVNFGDVFIGEKKTLEVEIINSGYGSFCGEYYMPFDRISSDPQFEVSYELMELGARAKSYLKITYAPQSEGTHNGTITLSAQGGQTYQFMVRGVADKPAHIQIDPDSINAGDLVYNEPAKKFNVKIQNTGNYPLEYVFPLFSDDTLTGVKKTSHKYGYSYISNLNDAHEYAYEWNELANATEIQDQMTDNNMWSAPVELGFQFPFYGKTYDKIYIGSYGVVSMTGEGFLSACRPPAATGDCITGLGLITAFGADRLQFDEQSKLCYGKQNGKFIISYENALLKLFEASLRITFRIVLNENGDIEFYYKDIDELHKMNDWGPIFNLENLFVGCSDIEVNDPFVITDVELTYTTGSTIHNLFKNNTAVKIFAPGQNMVKQIDFPAGVVAVGKTKELTLTVSADSNMYTGPLSNILTVLSTDPDKSTSYINLNAIVSGDVYKPLVALGTENLDLGSQFKTSILQEAIPVKNIGHAPVMITAMTLQTNQVNLVTPTLPYELLPGKSVDALITVPSDNEGHVTDMLTVTAANGQSLTAHISATIIGTPTITLVPDMIRETLASGSKKNTSVKVSNNGTEPLEYTIKPNAILYLADPKNGVSEETDYTYASSVNDENVIFNWEEVSKDADRYRVDYIMTHDYFKIGLPQKMPFYGEQYDTLYVFGNGLITFQSYKDTGGNIPNPPLQIPSVENAYSNYIAPYWGLHTPAQSAEGGIFYECKEDRTIISFMDYNNVMNIGICFQAILHYDGKIKYQYQIMENGQLMSLFGIVGMESQDHSKGIKIPERYIGNKLAIEFYPTKKQTLQPGENRDVTLVVDATNLLAGTYQEDALVNTNVPEHEKTILPVTLTVTGKAEPVFPAEVSFGEIVVNTPAVSPVDFEVSNAGTATFTITGFSLKNQIDPWYPFAINLNEGGGGGVAPGSISPLWMQGDPIVVGKEPRKFSVNFSDTYMIQNLEDFIVFTTDLPDMPTIEVPLRVSVIDSPSMEINQKSIELYAPIDTMLFDSVFTISNENGRHQLDYTVSIIHSNSPVKPASASTRTSQPKAVTQYVSPIVTRGVAAPQAEESEYIRELKYGSIGDPVSYIGTGDEYTAFVASISYTAPEDGFNIAAVKCLATIEGVSSGDIKAEIKVGSSYLKGQTIGSGILHVMDEAREYRTIQLDQNVYINPNETFYVVLTFPKGVKFPLASIAITDGSVLERYMAYLEEQWIDLVDFESQFGKIGFVVSCLEKQKGAPWISVSDPNKGQIAKGSKGDLTVHVNTTTARFLKGNRATVKISGTAPSHPVYSFNVTLDKNAAPEITQLTTDIEVSENNTATVEFKVVDNENDPFEISLEDDPERIASYELVQNTLTVTLSPKYDQEGNQHFTVVATDAYGHASRKSVDYYVQNTNRAPVLVTPIPEFKIHLGDVTESIDMTQVFTDPDGDTLRYVITNTDEAVGKVLIENDYLEIAQKATGETEITITAYDPQGLSAKTSFDLVILNTKNGGSSDQKITVYPNPVVYLLNIRCPEDIEGDVTFRMYDMGGNLVYAEKTVISAGASKTMDLSSYPSGVYILEMEYDGGKMNTKVVKQ